MKENNQYDSIVIGCGIAGISFAKHSAKKGKKICIISKDLGGTSFLNGALPVKTHLDALKTYKAAKEFISSNSLLLTPEQLYQKTQAKISKIPDFIFAQISQNPNIDFVLAKATILNGDDSPCVVANGKTYYAKNIVIATGSRYNCVFKTDGKRILDHSQIITLKQVPKSIVIVGLNIEACEYAAMYSSYYAQVFLVGQENGILNGFDSDMTDLYEKTLLERNVKIFKNSKISNIINYGDCVDVLFEQKTRNKTEKLTLNTHYVLLTGERCANIPDGISFLKNNNNIAVNDNYQTSEKNIYAIGDCNGIFTNSTHAIRHAQELCSFLENDGETKTTLSTSFLPSSFSGIVELCGAGTLNNTGIKYDLCKNFRAFSKNIDGFLKIVVEQHDPNIVCGIWFCCENASDFAGFIPLVLQKTITVKELTNSLYAHPVIHECLRDCFIE